MTADHARLKALALAAGGDEWEAEHDTFMCDGGGDWTIVDGAGNEIAYVDHADESPKASFIAAANPKAVLALLDQLATATQHQDDLRTQLQRAHAQVKGLREERDAAILTRNAALVRAITAEQRLAADPDDPLDDVLPLKPFNGPARVQRIMPVIRQVMPLNLPASLDLVDSEGGHHD